MDRSWVVSPSRSRSRPAPTLSMEMVRGCTKSSVTSVQLRVRRTSPSGSPCTVVAGPTGMTPRWLVGTTNSSSCSPPGASGGRVKRAAEMPTGSSTSSGSNGRRDSLVTSMRPLAGSPTVTRTGSTCVRMATCVRPTASSTENSSRARAAAAIISHSVQPIAAPTTQPVTPRASTAQPSG